MAPWDWGDSGSHTHLEKEPEPLHRRLLHQESNRHPVRHRSRSRRRNLGATGVGVVAMGVGVFFGVKANSIGSDIEQTTNRWTDATLDKYEEGEKSEQLARVFMTAGGIALIGGIAASSYFWIKNRGRSEAGTVTDLAIYPFGTGTGHGVGISGSF